MMGGTVLSAGAAPADEDPEAKAATSAATSVMGDVGSLLAHHAFSAANWVAMHCTRHMHLYGTTKEQLGAIAVSSRAKAALNPLAVYRDPMTLGDYLRSDERREGKEGVSQGRTRWSPDL